MTNTHGGRRDNTKRRPDDKRGGRREGAGRPPRHDGKLAAWLPIDDMALAQRLMLHFPEAKNIDELFSLALYRLAAHTDD